MTGCDFLWAVCGVVGAVCRAVCGVRAAVGVQWCSCRAQLLQLCGMSCGRAGLMCLYSVCECALCGAWLVSVRCFWVTRTMTLTCRCGGWGLSHRLCLRARVCGVMVAGSAAVCEVCIRPARM